MPNKKTKNKAKELAQESVENLLQARQQKLRRDCSANAMDMARLAKLNEIKKREIALIGSALRTLNDCK